MRRALRRPTARQTTSAYDVVTNFTPPAFTPLRTIVCTTRAEYDTAFTNLLAGDYLDVRGVRFDDPNNRFIVDKTMSDYAEVHFDPYCTFTSQAGSGFPSCWVNNAVNLRFYGGAIDSPGGSGVLVYGCSNFLWWNSFVHECASGGWGIYGITSTTGIDVRGRVTRCGLDLSLDPHAEKGTGLHGVYIGSGSFAVEGRLAFDVYDQPSGAAIQINQLRNTTLYCRARGINFPAQSQVAGNALQFWSDNTDPVGIQTDNVTVPYLEAVNCQGRAVDCNGIQFSDSELNTVTIKTRSATRTNLNPAIATTEPGIPQALAYDSRGQIVYA